MLKKDLKVKLQNHSHLLLLYLLENLFFLNHPSKFLPFFWYAHNDLVYYA